MPDRRHRVRAGGRSTNHPADGSTDDSSDWPAYDSTDNRSCHRTVSSATPGLEVLHRAVTNPRTTIAFRIAKSP